MNCFEGIDTERKKRGSPFDETRARFYPPETFGVRAGLLRYSDAAEKVFKKPVFFAPGIRSSMRGAGKNENRLSKRNGNNALKDEREENFMKVFFILLILLATVFIGGLITAFLDYLEFNQKH